MCTFFSIRVVLTLGTVPASAQPTIIRAARMVDAGTDFAFQAAGNAIKTVEAGFTTVRDFAVDVTVALAKAVVLGGNFRRLVGDVIG